MSITTDHRPTAEEEAQRDQTAAHEAAPAGGPGWTPPGTPAKSPRPYRKAGFVALIILGLAAAGVAVTVLATGGKQKLTTEQLIAQATKSVVRIEGRQPGGTAGGSGVVVDARRRLVLTNYHVVAGMSALHAQVGNNTTTSTPVRLVAASPSDDLAIVQLVNDVPGLRAMPSGRSSALRPGDQVIVLGFPGSAQSTLTGGETSTGQSSTVISNTGTVSQTDIQSAADPSLPAYQHLIVHQAPVNPGNSGGALLNQNGQLVGINTLGGNSTQGQYYSIAIDYAKTIIGDLENGVSTGYVGWSLVQVSYRDSNLKAELTQLYGNEGASSSFAGDAATVVADWMQQNGVTGMYVTGEDPGSAADKSRLPVGALITQINGVGVNSVADVSGIVSSATPGQALHVTDIALGDVRDPQFAAIQIAHNQDPTLVTDVTVPKH